MPPLAIAAGIGAGGSIISSLIGNSSEDKELELQQQEFGLEQQQFQEKQGLIDQNQPFLSQFEGAPDRSPFYNSLYTKGVESTNQAYANARANVANNARMSGFGYQSPNVAGSGAELQASEAGALAEVPTNAEVASANEGMSAANIVASEAGGENPNFSGPNQLTTLAAGQQEKVGAGLGNAVGQAGGAIPTGTTVASTPISTSPGIGVGSGSTIDIPSPPISDDQMASVQPQVDWMDPAIYQQMQNQQYGGSPFSMPMGQMG